MFEELMATVGSWFGDAGLWGEIESGASDIGSWLMSDSSNGGVMSSNLMSAVSSAIGSVGKLSAASQLSHPHATSTAFHYQSTANPQQSVSQMGSYMKNDINVDKGLSAMRGMKW